MSLEEQIIKQIRELPESRQSDVLDFVKYLRTKTNERDWSVFTLSFVMRGMEHEDSLYTLDDLKETFL